jgi:RHS repeat-associated protein
MKNMKRFIMIGTILAVAVFVSVGAQTGDESPVDRAGPTTVNIAAVSVSAATDAAHPGSFLCDGDQTTGWSLTLGQTTGWAEFALDANTMIFGAQVTGAFLATDKLSIEYLNNNRWTAFAGGFTSGQAFLQTSGSLFIDLSYERAVTNKIRLNFATQGGSLVREVKILGVPAMQTLSRLTPESLDVSDNVSPFYPARNLLDGNTYTAMKTVVPPLSEEVLQALLAFLADHPRLAERVIPALDKQAQIVFHLKDQTAVSFIRLFLQDGAKGDIVIETAAGSGWNQVGTIPQGGGSGWKSVGLSASVATAVATTAIRLTVTGTDFGLGGIAEFEIWGFGNNPGAWREDLGDLADTTLNANAYSEFNLDQTAHPGSNALEFVCEGDIANNLAVSLNGLDYSLAPELNLNGNMLFRLALAKEKLSSGSNFLRIGPLLKNADPASFALLKCARLAAEPGDGEVARLASAKVLAGGNGQTAIAIPLRQAQGDNVPQGDNSKVFLKDAEAWSGESVSTRLYAQKDGILSELDKIGIDSYYSRFAPLPGEKFNTDPLVLEKDASARVNALRILGSPITDRAPAVSLVWPADGTEINLVENLRFVIGMTDNENTQVSINGIQAHQRGHYFWLNLAQLNSGWQDGALLITAVAADGQGRTGTATATIYKAPQALLTVNLPESVTCTTGSQIAVSGTVSGALVDVKVNGSAVTVSQKNFSTNVSLNEGLNIITVYAKHRVLGTVATLHRKVVRYSGDLALTVNSPAPGQYVHSANVVVTGTVRGAGNSTVTVNGTAATVSGTGFASSPIGLSQGTNTITVSAQDQAGRQKTVTLTVYRDDTPPQIGNITPAAGAMLKTSAVAVSLNVTDASPVWATVNGQACIHGSTPLTMTTFTTTLTLADGPRQLIVTASDAAGNTSTSLSNIIVDTTPPEVFTVTATPAGWTNNNRPVLSFSTTDATSGIQQYLVSTDGTNYVPATSPLTLPVLSDGEHLISVKAVDNAAWERLETVTVYIDTTAPAIPAGFKVIPGNTKAIVSWQKTDDDVAAYTLERNPGFTGGAKTIAELTFTDTELTNGQNYAYRITALDRAGNSSVTADWITIESGVEREAYNGTAAVKAEFDGVDIYFPPEPGIAGGAALEIKEKTTPIETETALNPIASPVYRIGLVDAADQPVAADVALPNTYIAALHYNEAALPAGFDESNVEPYYFDPLRGRWTVIEGAVVDTDANMVYFVSGHFTDYTVQATQAKDLEPEQYKEAGLSPFKTYAQHGSITVSQQGGSAHTEATELVFPGPGGFDLAISRHYDTSTATRDGQVVAESAIATYLKAQGDFTYSMGKGWRLNLPYVMNTNKSEVLVLSDGSMHPFMGLTHTGGDYYWLNLTSYEGEWFSIYAHSEYVSHPETNDTRLERKSYTLRMKDGTEYLFDGTGRCTQKTDPTGLNKITVVYKSANNQIDYIQDALGRKVYFDYTAIAGLPYINKIRTEGKKDTDSYYREITYTQDANGILTQAVDAGSRLWEYGYTTFQAGGYPSLASYDFQAAYKAAGDSTSGLDQIIEKYKKPTTNVYPVNLLSELRGPGKGIIDVSYGQVAKSGAGYTVVSSISIYPTDSGAVRTAQRTTGYAYTMDDHTVPAAQNPETPEYKRGYINSCTETDGNRVNEYTYGAYVTESTRKIIFSEDEIKQMPADSRFNVNTRALSIVKEDTANTGHPQLETVLFTYADGALTSRPWKQKTSRGTNLYTETIYAYDIYGNPLLMDEVTKSSGRENRVVKKAIYNGSGGVLPNSTQTNYDSHWLEYSSPGFTLTYSGYSHDLVLAQMTINYVPTVNADGTIADGPGDPQYQYAYYEYSTLGQVLRTAVYDNSPDPAVWRIASFAYDNSTTGHGNLSKKTDSRSHETEFTYDSAGYMASQTEKTVKDADGVEKDITTSFSYDPTTGWLTSTTNPRGFTTSMIYDKLGRVVKIDEPDPNATLEDHATKRVTTTMNYGDSATNLYAIQSDPAGSATKYIFDDYGQLVEVRKGKGAVAANNVIDFTDLSPLNVTKLTYNRWGEIASITDPNANFDTNNHTTAYTYDAMGRRNKVTNPDGTVRTMIFDYQSNTLTNKDELGHTSTVQYDMKQRPLVITAVHTPANIVARKYYDGLGNEIVSISPRGGRTENRYNSLNKVIGTKMPAETFLETADGPASVAPEAFFTYDEAGNKIRDQVGAPDNEFRITDYTLDELGRQIVVSQKYKVGATETTLTTAKKYYDKNGNLTEEVDANHSSLPRSNAGYASTTSTYSAKDKVLTQTDKEGNVTKYDYYPDGNVKSLTGPRGAKYPTLDFTLVYTYDDLKRLTEAALPKKNQSDLEKPKIVFEYDPRGNLLSRTEPDGGKTEYTYTVRNKVKTESVKSLTKTYTTAYDYDAAGNVSSILDRRGKTTWQGYDDLNRLTSVRYPLLNTVSYGYDEDNNKTSVTDGNNHTTTFVYDLYKKLRSATTSEGETSATDYDRFGNVTRTKNALNKTRLYEYDRLNRLTKEKDERNGEYTFEYDDMGNITESHDPNLTTATYSYTDNYQISTLHLQNGSKTKNVSYSYDEEGAVKQVTDDNVTTSYNNADTAYLPDAYNRIKSEKTNINGKTFAVGYDYDVMDRITGITYPNDKLVTYSYNTLGEITGMSDTNTGANAKPYLAQAPAYDSAGFLQSIQAANGLTAAYLYDDNGRLHDLTYANAANVIKGYKFTYDFADNITTIEKTENTKPALPNTYTYDKDNRLTNAYLKGSFTVNVDTESQTALAAEDDLFGTEQLETAVSNVKLDYAAGSVGVNLGSEYQVTRIELTPQNQDIINNRVKPEDIRVFASVTSAQTYTEVPADQFTAKYVLKNEVWIIEIVMKTPVNGRYIKIKTDWDDRNDDFTWADKTEFGNNVDKLIKVYYNAETRDEAYEYDALGNRTKESITLKGKSEEVKNYGYYADGSRLKSNGKWAYVYDANGNVVKKGDMLDIGGVITKVKDAAGYLNTVTNSVNEIQFSIADKGTYWQYEYDLMNRMIKVSKNNEEIVEYTYSWKGYRVKKVKLNATADELKTTYYIFSPNGKLLYQEEEKYGTETANFYRQYDYLFNKLFAKDVGRVGTTTADVRFYYHTDHLGSVTAITDEAGDTAWGNEFTPFGSGADSGNKPDGGFKFATYAYDEDINLNYACMRWNDPETGRFTSLDPARDGMNWYIYCTNNPINFRDVTGLGIEPAWYITMKNDTYYAYSPNNVGSVALLAKMLTGNENNITEIMGRYDNKAGMYNISPYLPNLPQGNFFATATKLYQGSDIPAFLSSKGSHFNFYSTVFEALTPAWEDKAIARAAWINQIDVREKYQNDFLKVFTLLSFATTKGFGLSKDDFKLSGPITDDNIGGSLARILFVALHESRHLEQAKWYFEIDQHYERFDLRIAIEKNKYGIARYDLNQEKAKLVVNPQVIMLNPIIASILRLPTEGEKTHGALFEPTYYAAPLELSADITAYYQMQEYINFANLRAANKQISMMNGFQRTSLMERSNWFGLSLQDQAIRDAKYGE